ncbi:MAG TPA: hypothetical protein VF721_22670 [Pyrinomonadaceae bacterium]|jgi:hypothetical protein
MKRKVISSEQSLNFSDYFKLRVSTEDILAYFGYTKQSALLEFSQTTNELPFFEILQSQINDHLLHISLENEITRREFLIAPIMSQVRRLTQSKLRSEYWFEFNHQLRGSFDYYLRRENDLLVVEAKNADLGRGFTQLAVELIALDKAEETDKNVIYGAVSTGQEWQFAKLERQDKQIYQDINLYVLPAHLEDILRILIGILERK